MQYLRTGITLILPGFRPTPLKDDTGE